MVLATELLMRKRRCKMLCPGCGKENAMAYSALSNGLICLEESCGFELEMSYRDAQEVIEMTPEPELTYA
jgi:hypothetical protein